MSALDILTRHFERARAERRAHLNAGGSRSNAELIMAGFTAAICKNLIREIEAGGEPVAVIEQAIAKTEEDRRYHVPRGANGSIEVMLADFTLTTLRRLKREIA